MALAPWWEQGHLRRCANRVIDASRYVAYEASIRVLSGSFQASTRVVLEY